MELPLGLEGDVALERGIRRYALPAALLGARLFLALPPGRFLARVFFSMWVHELGHATMAWLCGFLAFPGPWFTPTALTRSPLFAVFVSALLIAAAVQKPAFRRWAVALLALQLFCTLALSPARARELILFAGDGGCLVLGALLMSTIFATGHLRASWLRWGFLVIGALAFIDPFEQWWAARSDPDRIPFGMNEGMGLSDPSVLCGEFAWGEPQLVRRYVTLGVFCLGVLAVRWAIAQRQPIELDDPA